VLIDPKRFRAGIAVCIFFVLVAPVLWGQEAEDTSYNIQLDGRKTWTLRYGLGSAVGLAGLELSPGQLSLDQTLSADIHGEALSILSVEAHFDDQQSDALQSMAIRLDTERLDGVLGDFVASGVGDFAVYGKKMTGLQLEYTIGDAVLTGVASRLEGISETKTYVGQRASAEVTYSEFSDGDPPAPRPYDRSIDGLYAYPLDVFYVEEFSEVVLRFGVEEGLRAVLTQYGLEYLIDVLADEGSSSLDKREMQVVGNGEQILLLLEDAFDLVRDRIEDAIDRFNDIEEPDEDAEYPFSEGTAYELAFLASVAEYVTVAVDDEVHPILDAVRRRYFDLGREGIVEASLVVEVSIDGDSFESVTSSRYEGYDVELFPDEGILEVEFPAAFFTDESAIRAQFDYTVTGGVFMLGLSIIPGSDRVSINDELLVRDEGYLIDYEIGMLVLLVEVADTDVIRIDYERFAGGIFGTAVDYATYYYGLTLDWPISEQLTIQAGVLQSAEDPGSVSDPDAVKTMPNRLTVAGISGTLSIEDLDAEFLVGYSHDQFPFDDNARIHRPNTITAIAATDGYVFFGHRSGLTVRHGGTWTTYGTSEGLAGRSVRALAVGEDTLFVGTSSGLTVVTLDGVSPLDRVANWSSYYAGDYEGLPSATVTALFFAEGVLWVGTDEGLVSIDLEDIDDLTTWRRPDADGGIELGVITALAGDGESIFVGTESGLYELSQLSEAWTQLPGSEGTAIHDLVVADGTLYVASDKGLRSYRDGIGTGWLVLGEAVHAVETVNGRVAYGSEDGLFDAADGEALLGDAEVTALGRSDDVLWIGTRADAAYTLTVWSYGADLAAFANDTTGIDGRDPFGFVDADAAEHTVEGFVERASFRHVTTDFTLTGRVENVSPEYRSIGSFGRSDSTEWDVTASWTLGDDADLSITHEVEIADRRSGDATTTMANDLSFQWTFGPILTASAYYATVNDDRHREGAETTDTSYRFSLRDRFFADRLDIVLSWSDATRWDVEVDGPRRSTNLTLNADGTILPSWTARLDWSRPVRSGTEEWSGSESLTFGSEWSGRVGTSSDLAVDYTLVWKRSIPGGLGSRDHEVELDIDVDAFETAAWVITPSAVFGATSDESSIDLSGRLSARGRQGDLSIQGTLRAGLTGIGEPVIRESEKLSFTASYTGIKGLRPTVTYSIDRQVASYEAQRQATIGHSLTARATWAPGEIHYDDLSLTITSKGSAGSRKFVARLKNSYRLTLQEWVGAWWTGESDQSGYPAVDLSVETDVHVRVSNDEFDVDASTTGQLNASFSPMWSGSFGTSYYGGTDSNGAIYGSLLFELTVAIDF
jgi:hypothetical protein